MDLPLRGAKHRSTPEVIENISISIFRTFNAFGNRTGKYTFESRDRSDPKRYQALTCYICSAVLRIGAVVLSPDARQVSMTTYDRKH